MMTKKPKPSFTLIALGLIVILLALQEYFRFVRETGSSAFSVIMMLILFVALGIYLIRLGFKRKIRKK